MTTHTDPILAFLLQKWLRERAKILQSRYVCFLIRVFYETSICKGLIRFVYWGQASQLLLFPVVTHTKGTCLLGRLVIRLASVCLLMLQVAYCAYRKEPAQSAILLATATAPCRFLNWQTFFTSVRNMNIWYSRHTYSSLPFLPWQLSTTRA